MMSRGCKGFPVVLVVCMFASLTTFEVPEVPLLSHFPPSSPKTNKDTQAVHSSPPLRFGSDGRFKIVQFADLHFAENEEGPWGPVQDQNSTRVMKNILRSEKPDLVVFSGDQLTGNNIRDNATNYWAQVVAPCVEMEVPWAIVFGNHDDAPLEENASDEEYIRPDESLQSTVKRKTLMEFDTSFPLSVSQMGPSGINGVSNYFLNVMGSANDNVQARLWLFDTGGGSLPETVEKSQVSWYLNTSVALEKEGGAVPSVAFLHIPLLEYQGVWGDKSCFGDAFDGVTPVDYEDGLFDAFLQRNEISFTFVGHDHGNDWCCKHPQGLELCFGRHTGYGGYGTWDRGARVVELIESSRGKVNTWVRMEDGRVIHSNNDSDDDTVVVRSSVN